MDKNQDLRYRLDLMRERLISLSRAKFSKDKERNSRHEKDIACVCCYFNPCGYKSKLKNYRTFYQGVKRTGVKLLTVELAFGSDDFELSEFDDILQLRTSRDNVMWQKERLLNIGIKKLIEEGYKKIAWLDADIVFEDDSWVEDLSRALDIFPVVHCFRKIFIKRNIEEEGEYREGVIKNFYDTNNIDHGSKPPGGGWGIRTDILKYPFLYDCAILGGGDCLFLFGSFYYDTKDWIDQIKGQSLLKKLNTTLVRHYFEWAKMFGSFVKGNVGYINHLARFLYHGVEIKRQYGPRYNLLKKHRFNPEKDIKLGENGVWEWASNKPELHKEVKNYFYSRKEDD